MLTGLLFIDNVDVYTTYGLVVAEGGLNTLIQWPKYKSSSIITSDWHEDDGFEADLSAPVLDGRTFNLKFYIFHGDTARRAQAFLAALASQVYHTLQFPTLNKTFSDVRYVSCGTFSTNEKFDTITVSFEQDTLTIPTASVPTEYTSPQLGYTIDDSDFGLFGCTVTKGTRATMWKYANAKANQSVSTKESNGIVYDSSDSVHLKSRDITINLHMRSSVAQFWTNWNALWAAVLKVDTARGTSAALRIIEGDGMVFQCHYQSNTISKFLLLDTGEVWCDFSITFSVLAYSRGTDWFYLATQASEQVTTEDQDVDDSPLYVRVGVPSRILSTLAVNAEQQTAVKISQLPSAGETLTAANGLVTIGVNASNQSVQVPIGAIMNALIDRVSSVYNIDNEHPLDDDAYYTLSTALPVIAADTTVRDAVKSGMVLIFFDGSVWRVWQYQLRYSSETDDDFVDEDNWMELAVSTNLAAKADKTYVDSQISVLQNSIDEASEKGGVKRVTQAQYDAIPNKDASTLYAVTNASDNIRKIYLGTTLIAKADTSGNNAFTYTFPIVFQS